MYIKETDHSGGRGAFAHERIFGFVFKRGARAAIKNIFENYFFFLFSLFISSFSTPVFEHGIIEPDGAERPQP
jgi:hypothetical protein